VIFPATNIFKAAFTVDFPIRPPFFGGFSIGILVKDLLG
jgi:hypothetical protein